MELFVNTLLQVGNVHATDLNWLQYKVHIFFKRNVQQNFLPMEAHTPCDTNAMTSDFYENWNIKIVHLYFDKLIIRL